MCALSWRIARAMPVAIVLACAAGCGSSLHPVQGKVTLEDGTPITKGMVVFESTEGSKTTARGDIQADGSYKLSTNKPGDGAPAGKYRVLVSAPVDLSQIDRGGTPPPGAFDKRFSDFNTSGLEFEVKSGANDIPIKVTRPGKAK